VVRPLRVVEAAPPADAPPLAARQRAGIDTKRAKPGRKQPRPYTEKQIGTAFWALHREIDDATIIAKTGVAPHVSAALEAAVRAYVRETDPHELVRSSLAYAAARLALGHKFAHVAKPSLLGIDLRRSPVLVAAIESKQHQTPLGKAYAVYRILAKGHDDVPKRREPSGELKRLLEWRLSQFTD
jgi:hypothetical protein